MKMKANVKLEFIEGVSCEEAEGMLTAIFTTNKNLFNKMGWTLAPTEEALKEAVKKRELIDAMD